MGPAMDVAFAVDGLLPQPKTTWGSTQTVHCGGTRREWRRCRSAERQRGSRGAQLHPAALDGSGVEGAEDVPDDVVPELVEDARRVRGLVEPVDREGEVLARDGVHAEEVLQVVAVAAAEGRAALALDPVLRERQGEVSDTPDADCGSGEPNLGGEVPLGLR